MLFELWASSKFQSLDNTRCSVCVVKQHTVFEHVMLLLSCALVLSGFIVLELHQLIKDFKEEMITLFNVKRENFENLTIEMFTDMSMKENPLQYTEKVSKYKWLKLVKKFKKSKAPQNI